MTIGILYAIIPTILSVILLVVLSAVIVSHAYLRKLSEAEEMRENVHLNLINAFRLTTGSVNMLLEGKTDENSEKVKELTALVSELNRDVDNYVAHEKKSKLEKEKLQKFLEDLRMEKDKITENANKQYVQLTNALEKLKNTEEALTKKKAEYNSAIKSYEKKLAALTEELAVNPSKKKNEELSKNEAEALEEKIEALEKENASSKKKMGELEKEYSSSQKTMEDLKKNYYALSNFVSTLKKTIAATIENLNEIKDATSHEAMSEVIYKNIENLNSVLDYNKED